MHLFAMIFESFLISASCSLDAFAASFAYGTKKIRIPVLSNIIISLICSAVFGLSLWAGSLVREMIPDALTVAIAFGILFIIGLVKLLDSVTKSIIVRYNRRWGKDLRQEFKFTLLNFSFILHLYANPEAADVNENKIISPAEAAVLAVSLSLDGIAVGFGAALGNVNIGAVIVISLAANIIAVLAGSLWGNKLSHKLPFNMSWASGLILVGLAFSKLA